MTDKLVREINVHQRLQHTLGLALPPPKVPFWAEFAYHILTDPELTPKLSHSANRRVASLYQQCKTAEPPAQEEWQKLYESPKLVEEVYSALALNWLKPMLPGDTAKDVQDAMQLWSSVLPRSTKSEARVYDLYQMVNRTPPPSVSVDL